MGLNDTPLSERLHIGFFGRRNAGKSSVVNAVTNQELSVVSDVLGTTTDPVLKAMELLPIGPVVIIDTPGFDDIGELGQMRVKKTKEVIQKTDVAVLVVDASVGKSECDEELERIFKQKGVKYIVCYNKSDLAEIECSLSNEVLVSAKNKENIDKLKKKIAEIAQNDENDKRIVADLIEKDDLVILVTPIDESAPKGRLILPQQQTIRDILDADACSVVVKETQLREVLGSLSKKPRLVICDSQVFKIVDEIVPQDIDLTSFSILFARYKGNFKTLISGAKAIDELSDGDAVLISEGCTHHRQCNDIGTVKLPNMMKKYTGKNLNFEFSSGREFSDELLKYKLVVHCGGCMLNEREMKSRIENVSASGVPVTNYGMALAYMQGILKRSIKIFKEL